MCLVPTTSRECDILVSSLCFFKCNLLCRYAAVNEKVWLHNRRFKTIQNLDKFTGVAMLHLENNQFASIGPGLRWGAVQVESSLLPTARKRLVSLNPCA
jgi:hypothetical protein